MKCSFSSTKKLESTVEATNDFDFIVGDRISTGLGLTSKISDAVKSMLRFTNLSIICAHQKFSFNSPDFYGGIFL